MRGAEEILRLPVWPAPPTVESLRGGRTNHNFRVCCGEQSFFARAGEDIPCHGILRDRELRNARTAAQAGLAPKVLHVIGNVQVYEFVPGTPLVQGEPISDGTLVRLARLLSTLHRIRLPEDYHPYDMAQVIHRQLGELEPGTIADADLLDLHSLVDQAPTQTPECLIHSDLIPENFIENHDRVWLVDWEYGGRGDPAIDLANLFVGFSLDEGQKKKFLEAYGPIDEEKVRAFEPLNKVRELVWCLTQIQHAGFEGDLKEYTRRCLEVLKITSWRGF